MSGGGETSHAQASFITFTFAEWLFSVLKFALIAAASSRISLFFPKYFKLPLLSGYILTGILSGPGAFSLIETSELKPLAFITQLALAFIAFSAGAELYLPELREVLRSVGFITAGVTAANVVIATVCVFLMLKFRFLALGFETEPTTGLLLACALLATSILVSLSPATTIAVVKETHAKGPFTSTLLGLVVVCDVVVLILFAVSSGMTRAQCCGGGFSALALLFLIGEILVSMVVGAALGKLIIFFLWLPSRARWLPGEWVGAILILPTGFLMFVLADVFTHFSEQHGKEVSLEPLLICIVGAYVATNQSKHRYTFIKLIAKCGPFIFIPFFTLSGCSLKLGVMLKSLGFALVCALIRLVCMAVGAVGGGLAAKSPPAHTKHMWLTLIAQSGVSMGLASKVGIAFPGFGADFATALVAVILINLLIGPVLCKLAIKRVGEAHAEGEGGDEEEGDEAAPLPKYFVLGADGFGLAVARRLADARGHVIVADPDEAALAAAEGPPRPARPRQPSRRAELGRAVEAEQGEEAAHGAGHGHGPARRGRVEARHVAAEADGLVGGLRDATRSLTKENCRAVVLALRDDPRNFEAAHFFQSYLHASRIVARVTNDAWRAAFVQAGALPVSDLSAAAHLAFHAAHTPAGSTVHVLNGKPTPSLFAAAIGKRDYASSLLPLSAEAREAEARAHPPPESGLVQHAPREGRDEKASFFMYMSARGEDAQHGGEALDLDEHKGIVPTLSFHQAGPDGGPAGARDGLSVIPKSGTQSSMGGMSSDGLSREMSRETSMSALLNQAGGPRTPSAAGTARLADDVI